MALTLALRFQLNLINTQKSSMVESRWKFIFSKASLSPSINPRNRCYFAKSTVQCEAAASGADILPSTSRDRRSPLFGLEDVVADFIFGKKKATDVAHSVWKHVVHKGDAVVDATCGNGYDTLALLQMVKDSSHPGHVYAMDIQETALESTVSLLDRALDQEERKLVEIFQICHSKMEEVVPRGITVRLVAFNLGYLPGGDKRVITRSNTTLLGLEAAGRILSPGGLITIVAYVGHPGGMEEFERVQAFASALPVDDWVCCKFQMLNRPLSPILVFLFKR